MSWFRFKSIVFVMGWFIIKASVWGWFSSCCFIRIHLTGPADPNLCLIHSKDFEWKQSWVGHDPRWTGHQPLGSLFLQIRSKDWGKRLQLALTGHSHTEDAGSSHSNCGDPTSGVYLILPCPYSSCSASSGWVVSMLWADIRERSRGRTEGQFRSRTKRGASENYLHNDFFQNPKYWN